MTTTLIRASFKVLKATKKVANQVSNKVNETIEEIQLNKKKIEHNKEIAARVRWNNLERKFRQLNQRYSFSID